MYDEWWANYLLREAKGNCYGVTLYTKGVAPRNDIEYFKFADTRYMRSRENNVYSLYRDIIDKLPAELVDSIYYQLNMDEIFWLRYEGSYISLRLYQYIRNNYYIREQYTGYLHHAIISIDIIDKEDAELKCEYMFIFYEYFTFMGFSLRLD